MLKDYSYQMYEMAHAALIPARAMSDASALMFRNPLNPLTHTPFGRNVAAGAQMFERLTRRYGKPSFGLTSTKVAGVEHAVREEIVWRKPFCSLIHFVREGLEGAHAPVLLLVAPMSGHYATLLRGTVEAFLPTHDVYITDWTDARMAPLARGRFRPRRLCRLPHRDVRLARAGRARGRRLPAFGAADVGGGDHGGERS